MGQLLTSFGTWLAGFAVAKLLAKIAGFVTIVVVGQELADYLIGQMFSYLGQLPVLGFIQLAGIPQFLGIIAGGVTFAITAKGVSGFFLKN